MLTYSPNAPSRQNIKTFYLPQDVSDSLKLISKLEGVNQSEMLRRCIRAYIQDHEQII
jgi:hypothetical protein